MYVTLFIVALIAVIMFHEFGHFATAKAFGMKCERFFLGFGPTLWSFQRGDTEYGVKAIPAGGFVKITGMSEFEDIDPADRGRTFYEQAGWKRAIVLSAGSATHFVVALVCLFSALAFVGLPSETASNVVAQVTEGSPAEAAGLQTGDVIVELDGQGTTDFDELTALVVERPGETVPVIMQRDGERISTTVTFAGEHPDGREVGFLGVAPEAVVEPLGLTDGLEATFSGDFSFGRLTGLTLQGLAQAFSPAGLTSWLGSIGDEGPRDPEGPMSLVGAGQVVGGLGQQGDFFAVLAIFAQLNIVLGALNMLPLPPLDGGHLAVLAVEEGVNAGRRLRGRQGSWRIDPARLTPIALAVILFFGMIMITALYLDITKPASDLLQ